MSYPHMSAHSDTAVAGLGAPLALGAAVAAAGALAVGVISGLTSLQSAKVAILLGWVIGLVISRAGPGLKVAAAAGLLSLAGSAGASAIGVITIIVRTAHVPLSIVLGHLDKVLSLTPQAIGWFGFLCWALSAVFGWAEVRRHGRMYSPRAQLAPGISTSPTEAGDRPGTA